MTEPRHPYRPLPPEFLTNLFQDPLDPGYADAAARRTGPGDDPPPGRWRPGMRWATVAALAAVGLLLAVAYQQVVAEEPTRTQVRADLERQIHDRQAETDRLAQRADQLRGQVAELRDQQLGDPQVVRLLRELAAVTGLGPVRGDGMVVRVDDGPPSVDPKTGQQQVDPKARILDRDLQQLANALWASGAEAIAINDRRLTATSTIRSASGAILIDRQPVAGPYRLAAIGAEAMPDRFAATEAAHLMGLLVDEYGITYETRRADELTLPAATEPQLRHATAMGGD